MSWESIQLGRGAYHSLLLSGDSFGRLPGILRLILRDGAKCEDTSVGIQGDELQTGDEEVAWKEAI